MVDAVDTEGDTALHKAVKESLTGHASFIEEWANPHLKNKRKISPLELAQKMKKDYDTMQVFEKDYVGSMMIQESHTPSYSVVFFNNNTCVVQEEFYNAFAPSIIVILSTTLI